MVKSLEDQLQRLKSKYPDLYNDSIIENPEGTKTLLAYRNDSDGQQISYYYTTNPQGCDDYQKRKLGSPTLDKILEAALVEALTLDKTTLQRVGNSGAAIQGYIKHGFVGRKPDEQLDYTDYWLLRKHASFMGHDLIVIEEEYMVTYIGCCVRPGAGVTVRVVGSPKNLEQFAKSNSCRFTENVNLSKELSSVGISASVPDGNYVSLSCRVGDA
jgi:hypothetical protein